MFLQLPIAYAQSSSINATTFGNAVDPILTNVVDPIIELMFALAIVVFAYGVLQLVWGGEEGRAKAKISMLSGIIGIFIMTTAWGIVYLVSNTVGGFVK